MKDCHTREGAARLVETIRNYWRARGHVVMVSRFQVYPGDPTSPWGVRSNLYNGLPPAR